MLDFKQVLQRISDYDTQHPFPVTPTQLYEPCSYILTLGGKRLRPALAVMAAELFEAPPEAALPVGWAVELFHNFSLIHDDIMDAAPLRRGQPTVHTRWNLTTGILSGDVMLIYAYQHLATTPRKHAVPRLLEVFNRVAIGVCEGQQYDMDFEQRDNVTLDEYTRMIELKTAVLLGGALEMGALAAGANEQDAQLLYDFGRWAGIAFQIQDDLLDTYGDPATFGKQVGGDIIQNKKTFLTLKTLADASQTDIAELRHIMSPDYAGDSVEKVAAVRALYDRNDIPNQVEMAKKAFEIKAFEALDEVSVPDVRKANLRGMVAQLLDRAH
jgi:geranylgeranyl diphosphate synthase, type II